jgi:hypothetical protein
MPLYERLFLILPTNVATTVPSLVGETMEDTFEYYFRRICCGDSMWEILTLREVLEMYYESISHAQEGRMALWYYIGYLYLCE